MYEIGDEISFKQDDSTEWKGPGTVLGQDGPVIFICQGFRYIKAHVCRTQPCKNSKFTNISTDDAENSSTIRIIKEFEEPPICNDDSINDDYIYNETDDDLNVYIKSESIDKANSSKENDSITCKPVQDTANIKTNTVIIFKDEQERECNAQILGRAGKATGKYKRCYNIMYKFPKELCNIKSWIIAEKSDDLKLIEYDNSNNNKNQNEENYTENVYKMNMCMKIIPILLQMQKKKELKSREDNNVYNLVKNENQKCISLHWVLTSKESTEGYIPKARLVAGGFEEDFLQNIDKELPTYSKDNLRILFTVATQNDWCLKSIDIKTAFLEGNILNCDVFIQPPPEARCPQNCIWKLNKCVYSLCDASLKWRSKIREFVAENDGTVLKLDPALFMLHKKINLLVLLVFMLTIFCVQVKTVLSHR